MTQPYIPLPSLASPNEGNSSNVVLLSDSDSDIPIQRVDSAASEDVEMEHKFYYFPPTDSDLEASTRSTVENRYGIFPQRPSTLMIILMACCPCLTKDPCSSTKKLEYKSVPKTIVFFLSVIQVALFIISVALDGFAPLYENWMIGPTGTALVRIGAKYGPLMRYKYQLWRLITPMFLHAGIIQLSINLFYQLRMGLYLEPRWGWTKFAVVYFTSGFCGIISSCVVRPNTVSVAASFSLMGVMAAWFAQIHMTWKSLEGWQKKMNLSICLVVILITFLEGAGPSYVDSIGHLGGLIMGLFLGYVFFIWKSVMRKDILISRGISSVGFLLILLFTFIMLSLFYSIVEVDPVPIIESSSEEYSDDYYDYEYNSTIPIYSSNTTVFNTTNEIISYSEPVIP